MTLRMADGPVANLPPGLDAYAGYVNVSGIGETFPGVVARFPTARHLSITTDGMVAMCADVESGAMSNWTGYPVGYCAVSNVNATISRYGRPEKLWTAHYDPKYGAHICSPACWPGLVTTADGTQWTDHGSADWDESLLLDNFFGPVPPPTPPEEDTVPVSALIEFPTGRQRVFQIYGGALWHKWRDISAPAPANTVWNNEPVAGPLGGKAGPGAVTLVGAPAVSLDNNQVHVTCEDDGGRAWHFAQGPTGPWGVDQLP